MTLMTLPEVRKNVETGLEDDALQLVMDGVEQDIDQQHGEVDLQVDDLEGGLKSVFATRPISSITTIVETVGTTETTLAADDYKLRHNSQIDRLNTGTNARIRWGDRVEVTYVPVDDTDKRRLVYIRLIELAIKYNALGSERVGDYSAQSVDFAAEREKILGGLKRRGFFM